jgi:hypothetical protein
LLRNHSDAFDDTRRSNLLAIEAKLESLGVCQEVSKDLDTFEQYFNAACHLIEKEKYTEALTLINKSLGKFFLFFKNLYIFRPMSESSYRRWLNR